MREGELRKTNDNDYETVYKQEEEGCEEKSCDDDVAREKFWTTRKKLRKQRKIDKTKKKQAV